MKLYCSNKLAIGIAHNPVQHDWTKNIEVDRNLIKEKLESGFICIKYVLFILEYEFGLNSTPKVSS